MLGDAEVCRRFGGLVLIDLIAVIELIDSVAAEVHHAVAEELFALLGVPADRRRRPAVQVTHRLPG